MEIVATLIPLKPNLMEMTNFSLMGFAIVMFVLAVLAGITSLIGLFFKMCDKPAAPSKKAGGAGSSGAASKPAPGDKEFAIAAAVATAMPSLADDSEIVAVLAAAAYAATGEPCAVLSYREAVPDFSYARQGRQEIFDSHVIIPARAR